MKLPLENLNDYLAGTGIPHPTLQGAQLTLLGTSDQKQQAWERLGNIDSQPRAVFEGFDTITEECVTAFALEGPGFRITGSVPDFGTTMTVNHSNEDERELDDDVLAKVCAHIMKACGTINWEAVK